MTYRKKLIEVALPLEAINKESAREKSIRHGHPSTLHLWWARRPLAACRAVLFASLVDDPSSRPDLYPTVTDQDRKRGQLFDLIEELVKWENINNEDVLNRAKEEILLSTDGNPPPVYDPFCGGGSIPLEAQRLGLEAHGSDLNPVAVLITKALIEIPPKFKNLPPVNPESRGQAKPGKKGKQGELIERQWKGAQGLAEDVRYYGQWMRDEAERRIGHLYPKVKLPPEKGGGEATVIAWLWARTVKCPNPTCGCQMPLVRSFALSTKKGKETWVEPEIDRTSSVPVVQFAIRSGASKAPDGTVGRKGAICVACQTPVPLDYVRSEGKAKRMNAQMMAIVAEGKRGRIYLLPDSEHEKIASSASRMTKWRPEIELVPNSRHITPVVYGMTTHADLFTCRQLVALTTFSDLVREAREQVLADAVAARMINDNFHDGGLPVEFGCGPLYEGVPLEKGGNCATAYADAVATYLGLAVSKLADASASLVRWKPSMDQAIATFGRQAIPMVWDYAESNIFNNAAGDYQTTTNTLIRVLENLRPGNHDSVKQFNATNSFQHQDLLISTDPPYYDAVPYADLSDFFYVWLRRSLSRVFSTLFGTLLVPKAQELVADPFRNSGKDKAKEFFERGLSQVFSQVKLAVNAEYPFTVYYAFKQTESDEEDEPEQTQVKVASTGWETMLEGLIQSGFSITGTLPLRTELGNRMRGQGSNALASSIVLVCRPRPDDAPSTTRRRFVDELKAELPDALKKLQQGNIAPVDLAQASIGPGMAIYSRYAKVLESDGSPMRVRTALQLINQTLDEFLAEQEGEFDTDTRWALAWFEQYQFNEGLFGDAETLSKAKNTSIKGMGDAGILTAKAGKVQLVPREALPDDWNPGRDSRIPVWEATQQLIRTLDRNGETGAARLLAQVGDIGEIARDLAYRLYSICDRKGWTQEAIAYNSLVISWSEIARLAAERQYLIPTQTELEL